MYHLTEAAHRQQALAEARRVLVPGGRLLAMAVCRFAALAAGETRSNDYCPGTGPRFRCAGLGA
jgi:ubiquinone/menaquinone biosynthesis C-methylase UbiE